MPREVVHPCSTLLSITASCSFHKSNFGSAHKAAYHVRYWNYVLIVVGKCCGKERKAGEEKTDRKDH